jgi:hypothetical protein
VICPELIEFAAECCPNFLARLGLACVFVIGGHLTLVLALSSSLASEARRARAIRDSLAAPAKRAGAAQAHCATDVADTLAEFTHQIERRHCHMCRMQAESTFERGGTSLCARVLALAPAPAGPTTTEIGKCSKNQKRSVMRH